MRSMKREIEFSGVADQVRFAGRVAGVTIMYAVVIAAMCLFRKFGERSVRTSGGP